MHAINNEDSEEEHALCVYNVQKNKEARKVTMKVNDVDMDFILYTGCPVTLISETVSKQVCNDLKPCNLSLTSYTQVIK